MFPGLQGGPLMHVIAAKAVAFGEALQPEFRAYARAVVENAKALAEVLSAARLRPGIGRHRQRICMLVDLRPKNADRQRRREGAGPRPHHLQQERHAVRSGEADRDLGHPPRHAGRHHARLRRGRVPRRSAA